MPSACKHSRQKPIPPPAAATAEAFPAAPGVAEESAAADGDTLDFAFEHLAKEAPKPNDEIALAGSGAQTFDSGTLTMSVYRRTVFAQVLHQAEQRLYGYRPQQQVEQAIPHLTVQSPLIEASEKQQTGKQPQQSWNGIVLEFKTGIRHG